jgi:[ribosomal protein S5]-alanine N-acetyltransferase
VDANLFDPFPVLETPRLVLRRLRPDDTAGLHACFSDEETMRYWSSVPHTRLEETEDVVAKSIRGLASGVFVEWAVTLRDDDTAVGKVSHHRWIKAHFRSEIGYILRRDLWGRGIVHEALAAIITFGFERMKLHSIEAQVDPENERSVRVLERLAFVKEGHLRESFFLAGRFTDTGIYSLLRTPRARPA